MMRAVVLVGLFAGSVFAACGAPSIDDGGVSPGVVLPNRLPADDGGDSGSSSGGELDSGPASETDTGVDAAADAGVTLEGTWSGTYTNARTANGCTFANAGDLTATYTTTGTDVTTTAMVTGLEIRDQDCNVVGHVTGAAPSSAVTTTAGTSTGTWDMAVQIGGDLPFPFTAKTSGTTMTGSWTCTGCTGTFTLTKK